MAVAVGLLFWKPLQLEEKRHIRQITEVLARSVRADILDELRDQVLAEVRFAKIVNLEGTRSQTDLEAQAKQFLINSPGYLAVQFVDRNYQPKWSVVEEEGNAHQTDLLTIDPSLRRALNELVNHPEKDAIFTSPYRLWNGRTGRRRVVPLYSLRSCIGFLTVIVDEGNNFEDILSDHAGLGYSINILEGSNEIYELSAANPEDEKIWAQDAEVAFAGASWRIRVWPEPKLLSKLKTPLNEVALVLGALIGLLLFTTLDFARVARRTSQALRHSQGRLAEMIGSAMDAIISVDKNQRIVVFNRAAEVIFRCASSEAIGQPVSRFIPERFREAHWQHIENFGHTGISMRSMTSLATLCGLRADGEEFPLEASISQTTAAAEKLYTVILRDISRRKRAEEELRQARDTLESRVQERTAELALTNIQLQSEIRERRQAEDSLKDLSARLLQLRDEEQRRIARELHDSTAQILGALALELERVQQRVAASDTSKAQELLVQASELAEEATAEIRTLSYLLHPPMLDDLGLEEVLPWYVDGFSRRSGIRVFVDIREHLGRLPQEVELTLFRAVQEALTNIRRHSGSPTAQVALTKDAHEVTLRITDHGGGIPPEVLERIENARAMVGIGIAGMRERARQLKGRLEIESVAKGTSIKVILPIDDRPLAARGRYPGIPLLQAS